MIQILAGALAIILAQPVSARDFKAPEGWINDCVGRMQISLPGPSEVAAYSAKDFSKLFGETTEMSPLEFKDGQITAYSTGDPITHAVTQNEIDRLLQQAKKRLEAVRLRTKKSGEGKFFEEIKTRPEQAVIYRYKNNYSAVIAIGRHLIDTRGATKAFHGLKPEKI